MSVVVARSSSFPLFLSLFSRRIAVSLSLPRLVCSMAKARRASPEIASAVAASPPTPCFLSLFFSAYLFSVHPLPSLPLIHVPGFFRRDSAFWTPSPRHPTDLTHALCDFFRLTNRRLHRNKSQNFLAADLRPPTYCRFGPHGNLIWKLEWPCIFVLTLSSLHQHNINGMTFSSLLPPGSNVSLLRIAKSKRFCRCTVRSARFCWLRPPC